MQVGGPDGDVQVTAESPIIDVKQNAATLSIESELIERIPRGRNFTSVLTSAPGTNQEAKAGGSRSTAPSGSENRFVIDGMDTTNLRTGVSTKPVLLDFVEEVQVKSSGYNAEYRATTGGVVSADHPSGGNTYRGECRHLLFERRLAGNVRPAIRLNPANQTQAEYITTPRDPAYNCGSGSSISAVPILRDKVWFYVGYGPQFSTLRAHGHVHTEQPDQTFANDTEEHNFNYNVTSQLNNAMRLKFSGSNQRSYGGSTLPAKEANGYRAPRTRRSSQIRSTPMA